MGAHIAGAAGRHFTSLTNKLIPRITGMDSMLTHRTHIFMRYLYSNLIIIIICYLFQALILLGKCVRARVCDLLLFNNALESNLCFVSMSIRFLWYLLNI